MSSADSPPGIRTRRPLIRWPEVQFWLKVLFWLILVGAAYIIIVTAVSTKSGSVHGRSRGVRLMALAGVLHEYAYDHRGYYPELRNADDVRTALYPYSQRGNEVGRLYIFIHDGEPFFPNPILSNKTESSFPSKDLVAFYESREHDGYHGVVLLDGTVRYLNATEWNQVEHEMDKPLPKRSGTSHAEVDF